MAFEREEVVIPAGSARLKGELVVPPAARAVVVFVHGSGSSRLSPRNRHVAESLNEGNLGTLLFDLLTELEEDEDRVGGRFRFEIDLLTKRLLAATDWLASHLFEERGTLDAVADLAREWFVRHLVRLPEVQA